MRILGIDPGFGRLGFGVIDVVRDVPQLVVCGCLETSKEQAQADRLRYLQVEIEKLVREHAPERIGVERLFFQKNVTTAIRVAEARGMVLALAAAHALVIREPSPQEVKIAVTGYGNAEKRQVQEMVKLLLHLKAIPRPDDAADALAIAIAASRM